MTNIPKKYLLCALLAGALAACKEPDAFYSTAYDIVRVDFDVELETAAAPDPDGGSGQGTGGGQTEDEVPGGEQTGGGQTEDEVSGRNAAGGGTLGRKEKETSREVTNNEAMDREAEAVGTDYRALIAEEAANWAPVGSGGSYLIDYTRYDGGPLRVRTSAGSGTIEGVFLRTPGTDAIGFVYNGRMHTYTLTTYGDQQGRTRTLLQVDLTEHFRTRYPEAGIVRVLRLEYTSHE